jgi:hypothetical protein
LCRLIFHLPIFLLCLHRDAEAALVAFLCHCSFSGGFGQKAAVPALVPGQC